MFDEKYIIEVAEKIINCDSPTGFTNNIMRLIEEETSSLGFTMTRTKKGNGIIEIKGSSHYTIGLSTHVDTLGLMVKAIKSDGTIKFTSLGGTILSSYHGEYCTIYTRSGKKYTGTILTNSPAAHVYSDAKTIECNEKNMHIRLDNIVYKKEDTEKLEIKNGDFIAIEPKFTVKNGYIKSRFLDDKISVAMILTLLKYIKKENFIPKYNINMLISTYEEVGHGMAYIPDNIDELISIDMGCIGEDLECTEEKVSICAKDASGPYDYEIVRELEKLAINNNIPHAVDVYTLYASDTSAALHGGNDIKGALIGTGVAASHGMERTHINGVKATLELLYLYIK
ncbi:MAG: M42 family metallopeptidase [Lachnospirales bacterium]